MLTQTPRTGATRAPVHTAGQSWQMLSQETLKIHRLVWLSLLWGHGSFPLGSSVHRDLFVSSKSLCFTQSCGSFIIKSHWPSKSDSLGIPSLCQIPRLGSLMWGLEPSQKCENFSGNIILHYVSSTGWVWDLTSTWLCPSYNLFVASPLSCDIGYLFFFFFFFLVGSSILLSKSGR